MGLTANTSKLVDNITRLRRAERIPGAARDVVPVRRELERQLPPTLTRSMSARVLGVSPTAIERWVRSGHIPMVVTPGGRREVPRGALLDIAERTADLRAEGHLARPLAAALRAREPSHDVEAVAASVPHGHDTADRRSLALHRLVARRLDDRLAEEARQRVEELSRDGSMHPGYARRWRELLSLPLDEIAKALVADDQETRDLRQNTPFTGAISDQERRRLIAAVR